MSNFNPEDEKTFGYCTSLAQVFMNEFIKNNKASIATRQDDNHKKDKVIVVNILKIITTYLICKFDARRNPFSQLQLKALHY